MTTCRVYTKALTIKRQPLDGDWLSTISSSVSCRRRTGSPTHITFINREADYYVSHYIVPLIPTRRTSCPTKHPTTSTPHKACFVLGDDERAAIEVIYHPKTTVLHHHRSNWLLTFLRWFIHLQEQEYVIFLFHNASTEYTHWLQDKSFSLAVGISVQRLIWVCLDSILIVQQHTYFNPANKNK